MSRYQNRLNRIFSAGIVWDPEEPLPEELQDDLFRSNGESQDIRNTLQFSTGLLATGQVDGPFRGPTHGPTHGPTQVTQLPTHLGRQIAATWPVEDATKRLPRFTVQEQGRNVLPPLSVTADVSIVQDTARVTVTQLFWNDSGIPIKKAAFTFPLATGCTVTDFSCRIGANKIIKGAVKPKEEAREAFRDHIRQHETAAALLEQDTPEIFTTTLGNVPEKTKVKVELTYITVLKHRFADNNNTTTLTIPTSIAPRYGDVPEEYNDAATTSVPQGLSLEVEIVESEKITSIVSTSHAIAVTRRRGARTAQTFADLAGEDDRSNVETASVALESGRIFLDNDFVLDIVTTPDGNNENPQAWLEEHPTLPNHKTLMLTLPPGFLARKAPPVQQSEILFLADCSGSMRDKIKPLRSAMQFFLKGIPEGRKFNIWCFGTKYAFWQPQSVDYTEETLNSALSWVETGIRANMGGTELLPAVQAIVAAREKALMTDVIVLTDGQTWRLEQTLDFIQKTRGLTEGRVRFFALGIGNAVSHALVDGIAKAGGGYAEVVREASQGGWEDRVVSMAKAALMSAHLGPLHLEFNIQDQTGNMRSSTLADAKRSPADTSALNPFDRSRVYFHLDCLNDSESITSIQVEVQANYNSQTLNIPVTILDKRDTTLHKLAARAMLDDLERSRSHIHLGPNRPLPGSWQETSMVRKEAEAIACKWSLVSKWTSFFLAEEPYTPTGDDAFMDGVVEIKVSPGDDLLQPYGAIQHIATLELAGPHTLTMTPSHHSIPTSERIRSHSHTPRNQSSTSSHAPSPLGSGSEIVRGWAIRRGIEEGSAKLQRDRAFSSAKASRSQAKGDEKDDVLQERAQERERLRRRFDSSAQMSGDNGSDSPSQIDRDTSGGRPRLNISTPMGSSAQHEGSHARFDSSLPADYDPYSQPYSQAGPSSSGPSYDSVYSYPVPPTAGYNIVGYPSDTLFGRSTTPVGRGETISTLPEDDSISSSEPEQPVIHTRNASESRSKDRPRRPPPVLVMPPPPTQSAPPPPTQYMPPPPRRVPLTDQFRRVDPAGRPASAANLPDSDMESIRRDWILDSGTILSAPLSSKPPAPPPPTAHEAIQSQQLPQPMRRNRPPRPSPRDLPDTAYPEWTMLPASAAYHLPRGAESAPVPIPAPEGPNQSSPPASDHHFVISLLSFQRYDGGIDFGSWERAEQVLGKSITEALRLLQLAWPEVGDQSWWTAAVDVLLKRQFQACKPLWELMAIKTASYCGNHPLLSAAGARLGLLEVVGKELEGVKRPFREEEEQQQQQEEEEPAVDLVPETVTVGPLAYGYMPEKSPKDKAKKGRKKRKAERGEQSRKEAEAEANPPPSLVGRFFWPLKPDIEEGSRHGTKSRRESTTEDKGKSGSVPVPAPVPDTGTEEDASENSLPSLIGRFFWPLKPEIEEGSRHGTKSRRESATVDKGNSVSVSVHVPAPVPDTGTEENASELWERVEAETVDPVSQLQNAWRYPS